MGRSRAEFDDRFCGAKQYKEEVRMADLLRELLRAGLREVNLALSDIGTHRLLARDVSFHDLGLIIVDEEHR